MQRTATFLFYPVKCKISFCSFQYYCEKNEHLQKATIIGYVKNPEAESETLFLQTNFLYCTFLFCNFFIVHF